MKKIMPAIILTLFLFSCQKEIPQVKINEQTPESIIAGKPSAGHPIICESWMITVFKVNGKDISSNYSEYTLGLCSDNLLSAWSSQVNVPGTWTVEQKPFVTLLQMNLDVSAINFDTGLELLNEAWEVLELLPDKISLVKFDREARSYKDLTLKKRF